MASLIVLNFKSRCPVSGFDDSTAGVVAVATGAVVGIEGGAAVFDLSLRLAFIVAFTFLRSSLHILVATTRCCIAGIALVR